jgi:methylated-DNA-[protein]-cysteine S-methyltransferase
MRERLTLRRTCIPTPLGEFVVLVDAGGRLRASYWTDHTARLRSALQAQYSCEDFDLEDGRDPFGHAAAIKAYFEGQLNAIDSLAVECVGTPFQKTVWHALREIPCGHTISYSELARRIGRPAAVRAVGLANGANPISVIVPCHRVIGANGTLTGYGGGLERKRWLLSHELARGSNSLFPHDALTH